MKIAIAASEAAPYIKTGGLGDVMQALPLALAAWDAYERLGSPEGELAIAELVVFLGSAPKSNSSYKAWLAAQEAAGQFGSLPPPKHILNAPTKLMKKLGYPTLFCNSLEVADDGEITGFKMRVEQSKLTTVKALQSIGFETIASGDSYNDLGMIQASKAGFLFRSTDKIKADYPQIPAYETYEELLGAIKKAMDEK